MDDEGPRLRRSVSDPSKVISTEDLREYFECPVCFVVPRSAPIYACPRGHMICRDCRNRLTHCPTCRTAYGSAIHRLYFAEKLLEERVPMACLYADQGCTLELPMGRMKDHETAGCPFQPISCKHPGCQFIGPRREFGQHKINCDLKPVPCPLQPCNKMMPKKNLIVHLQDVHIPRKNPQDGCYTTGTFVFFLFGLCLLSVFVNIYLIYSFNL